MEVQGPGIESGRRDPARAGGLASAVRLIGGAVIVWALALPVVSIAASQATSALEPERLAAPVVSTETRLTCGGADRSVSWSALTAPTGAEQGVGPEFEALREQLGRPDQLGAVGWRLASRGDRWVRFVADTRAGRWVFIDVQHEVDGWRAGPPNDCQFRVVLSPEVGPATWAIDQAFPAPTAGTTELHLLVWEEACSSGSPTTGRNATPMVLYDADTVTIILGVRPIELREGESVTCPMPEGTPVTLSLDQPLGGRTLLDGAFVPPAAPVAANLWLPPAAVGSPSP